MLQRFTFEAGAFFGDFRAENPLDADDVGVKEKALPVIGEMAAAENGGAGAGARRAVPELVHAGMAATVEVAAEGRAEVVRISGGIGDEVVAPVVKHASVRIGEAVGHVAHEFSSVRLVAVNGTIGIAHGAEVGFHIGAVEHAIAEINGSAGLEAHRVRLVVRVRGIEAVEHALLRIGLAVAIGIAQEPQIRRLHDEHTVFVKLESGRAIEAIGKHRGLDRLAGFGIEIEYDQFIEDLGRGCGFRIVRPCGDPKTALGVEVHLHRIDQIGEGFFGGDELDLAARREFQVLDRFFRIHVGHGVLAIRRGEVHGREIVVFDNVGFPLCGGPDELIAVRGFDIALREFFAENGGIGDALISDARTTAENVVLVHGAVAVVPFCVFFDDGCADFFELIALRGGWLLAENGAVLHGGEGLVAVFIQMDAVDGQR